MNLELLESFGQNFPEEFDGTLDCTGMAVCCKFNRWGSLLAVGCNDGRIIIFDFVTRGIAKILGSAHVMPICSLSWSRTGRKLVSASTDNTVGLWDILSGDCDKRFKFPSPIMKVQFHPRNEKKFLVCPLRLATVLVSTEDGKDVSLPGEDEQGADFNIVATFDRRGDYILTGNGRGKLTVFNAETLTVDASFRLPSFHAVKNLEASRRGDFFLTNSSDRVIRVFHLKEVLLRGKNTGSIEPVQKLQDMVNKTAWKTCCISGDSEYVCAGSTKSHSLYIWEKNSGSLVKILTGTKGEQLMDAQWHPARPLICSVSNGLLSIWSQSHVENWSAFAPDFKELDENVEYEERESEFDLEDEDRSVEMNQEKPEEDGDVDVTTVVSAAVYCSSDEESDGMDIGSPVRKKIGQKEEDLPLWFLPIAPEIEQPEENPYNALLSSESTSSHNSSGGDQNRPPSEPKKQKPIKEFDVNLRNAPSDETHPLLVGAGPSKKRSMDQTGAKPPGLPGRPPNKQRKIAK